MPAVNATHTQSVLKYLIHLILTGLFLGSGMLSLVLILFFIFPDNSDEGREIEQWCSEYMPNASRSKCTAEMGW